MATVNEKMTAIAEAIRDKTGSADALSLDGMAESIPDVYSAGQSSMVDESKLIPKTVSGSYISVDDVSEIPHGVECKVESVNLCPEEVKSGRYYDAEPNASGADAGYIRILPFAVEPLTTYTFSSNLFAYSIWCCGADGGIERIGWANSYVRTITTPENCTELRISLINRSGAADTTAFEYAMLNKGTTALPYTPYVKPEEVMVTRCGKNMLKYPHWHTTKTVNGITFTDNGDGTVTANGTATADATYTVATYKLKKGTTYTFSGCPVGGSKTTYYLNPRGYDYDIGAGKTLTPTYDFVNEVEIVIKSGTAISNLLFKPQWELGDKATKYEPYNGQTITPDADGIVEGMTSVSPYMNIFSDTDGVNIEATYNKSYGMQTEYDRFWDAFQQNGKRGNYSRAFSYHPFTEECFKPKYDLICTSSSGMFAYTGYANNTNDTITDLKTYLQKIGIRLDTSKSTYMTEMFYINKAFTHIPEISAESITDLTALFYGCDKLIEIEKLILKADGSNTFAYDVSWQRTFFNCVALKHIVIEGVIGNSVSFEWCPLTKASITSIVNALSSTVTGQTLTLKLSAVNTAFETSAGAGDGSTSAEFAALVATKTNWTITMI